MSENKDYLLKLENQICFSLYSVSRAFTRAYQPILDPLGLTYLQYLVMLVLWEKKSLNVKELGKLLELDSGTLTPVLKRMESQELIHRQRSKDDERVVNISLTEHGHSLKEKASSVPEKIFSKMNIDIEKLKQLKTILDEIIISSD